MLFSECTLHCTFLFSTEIFAQKKKNNTKEEPVAKFGEITSADFDPSLYSFDSTADAVVLFDRGISSFRESKDGWFILYFERHQRIKVLTKSGMDAANYIIPQYKSNKSEEKIEKLRASTFNLENGAVVETKLNEKDIYKDQLNKQYSLTKFGLPNVKEGSIIDVTYTVASDFLFNLRAWDFQGRYPRVHTEYTTRIPAFFVYVMQTQGFLPFDDKTSESYTKHFNLLMPAESAYESSRRLELTTTENEIKWTMKEVPALKSEPFTTTIDNYVSRINFQLSEYRFPNQAPVPVMSSWPKMGDELMKDEEFGAAILKNNNWLNEDIKKITAGATNDLEKAKALYTYMRDKFSLKSEGGKYMTDNPKNIWKNMKGNTADANIMLTLLLRTAGLEGDPVILSTRENGTTNEVYPLMNQYNYVVCRTEIDGKTYFLDATDPLLGFGYLPAECYNGHARLVRNMPMPVYLRADDVKESKTTIINLFSDDEHPWEGLISSKLGYYESLNLRKKIKASGIESVETQIKNALPTETEMSELKLEGEKEYDKVVSVAYKVDCSMEDEELIYINPLLGERTKENPFTAADRKYPVEMPYTFKETIIANIKVPAGFEVDEMPKQARVKLEEDQGMFEYLIQQSGELIQLRCVLDIKKANFTNEQYATLRDFFTYVVSKQSEQIVFKKKARP
jgi:hypothetical protein